MTVRDAHIPAGISDKLNELLSQSDVTRDALHQFADKHEEENVTQRGVKS